ncbi:MAG: EthD domain-containing protein [Sphingomonadaceae bacterium]
MEKIIYALWRGTGEERARFNDRLLGEVAAKLGEHAQGVRLNLQDADVAQGTSPRMTATQPQMDAVIQLWLPSANDAFRAPVDAVIGAASARFAAWLACESTILPNTLHPPVPGKRTEGFSQIVFLGRPPRLTWDAWRDAWQRLHTAVAVDTQANFEYVQNLIVRPLTYGAPDYAAMVEECFPHAALTDEAVYFDAVGDPAKCSENQRLMAESCARFIDFDRIDCIPTSQFDVKTIVGRIAER